MKVLLVAVNAKYIHSNLAVYDLKAYTENIPVEVELAEYTINQQQEEILRDIYEHKCFCNSCAKVSSPSPTITNST